MCYDVTFLSERLSALLPEEAQQQVHTVLPKRDEFEIAYRLDCRNLCSEFQEDISFHFTLGPMNLFRKLMGSNKFGIARQPYHYDAVSVNLSFHLSF
jgi:mitofusin